MSLSLGEGLITSPGCCWGTHWVAAVWPTPGARRGRRRPWTCRSGTGCTSSLGLWSEGRSGPKVRPWFRRRQSERTKLLRNKAFTTYKY